MDPFFLVKPHLSPTYEPTNGKPRLPSIFSLLQHDEKTIEQESRAILSPIQNLTDFLPKKTRYTPFRPVIPSRNSPLPSFLVSTKPVSPKSSPAKSRTKAEILNPSPSSSPIVKVSNLLVDEQQEEKLHMSWNQRINSPISPEKIPFEPSEREFEEIVLDEIDDIEEKEEEKYEKEDEECLVEEGTISNGMCIVCLSDSVQKKCIYCGEGYCPAHISQNSSPYPDQSNFLPFKCPTCHSKKPIGGISYVEETETKVSEDLPSLPPVVYQPSNLKGKPSQQMTDCLANVIVKENVCLTSGLPEDMKNYILYGKKRVDLAKSISSVQGMGGIEPFLIDGQYTYLHYKLDFSKVLSPIIYESEKDSKAIESSNVIFSILTRKAAVIENVDGDRKAQRKVMRKFHLRLEMFVDSQLWKILSNDQQNELYYLFRITEDWFHNFLQEVNFQRIVNGKNPFYLVSTRDCFRIKLLSESTQIEGCNGENFIKRVWYFPNDCIPSDYKVDASTLVKVYPDGTSDECWAAPVGVTTYHNVFSEETLKRLENKIDELAEMSENEKLKPNTAQPTVRFSKLVRTKFFFGARYLWQTHELQNGAGTKARGIRVDVDGLREWVKKLVEETLVDRGITEKNFINQHAINIYHDGSEGIKQHFDDANRFARPILSVRCFSPSRLCFGSLGFGMTNSLFFIPMERGCVTQLGPGYASDSIKHCVRSCDMTGKSATVLLRHVHENLLKEAVELPPPKVHKKRTPSHSPKKKSKQPKRVPLKDTQNVLFKEAANNSPKDYSLPHIANSSNVHQILNEKENQL